MAGPLDAFIQQLHHLVWTRFLPLIILTAVVGILLRKGVEKLTVAIVRFFRSKPSAATVKEDRRPIASDAPYLEKSRTDAPCCPKCRRQMVQRKARRGANSGSTFWGCPGFPECTGTRSM